MKVNVADSDGHTALHIAVQRHPRVVGVLLEHGADPTAANGLGATPLQLAMGPSVVKQIIDSMDASPGGIVDIRDLKDRSGCSPFQEAPSTGAHGVVRSLLERGFANVQEKDREGKTALDFAVTAPTPALLNVILDFASGFGRQALWLALLGSPKNHHPRPRYLISVCRGQAYWPAR